MIGTQRQSWSLRLHRRTLFGLAFVLCLVGAACDKASDSPPHKEQASQTSESRLQRVRKQLPPELLSIQKEHQGEDRRRTIVLLGENHASVKTQIQLADTLQRLGQAGLLDAILIEGSHGPVEHAAFAEQARAQGADNAYWRQALEWGQIAGYEYYSLTHPSLRVHGVEDMGAKARFEIQLNALSDNDNSLAQTEQQARTVVKQALACLEQRGEKLPLTELRAEVSAHEKSSLELERAMQLLTEKSKPLTEAQLEITRFTNQPSFKEMMAWEVEFSTKVKAFNAQLQRLKQKENRSDLPPRYILTKGKEQPEELKIQAERYQELDLTVQMTALAKEKEQIEELKTRLEGYQQEHKADLDRLKQLLAQRDKISKQINKELSLLVQGGSAESHFFALANLVRELDAADKKCSRPLDLFFAVERKKQHQQQINPASLAERDDAMVANTIEFFKRHSMAEHVVLLIGAAHLESMAPRLERAGFSYVSAKLSASDAEIERWELQAWSARQHPDPLLFSKRADDGGMKEKTRLNDAQWQADQLERIKLFKDLEALAMPNARPLRIGSSTLYEHGLAKPGSVMRLGKLPLDRNANLGEHVLSQGPMPGAQGQFYALYDRHAAERLITELSGSDTAYSYYFQTEENGRSAYRFKTPGGEIPLASFASSPPQPPGGKPPKRVVLFGEPDDIPEGGGHVSPLWRELRTGAGGGGRKPPGGKPGVGAAAEEPGGGGKPPRGPRWTQILLGQAAGGNRRAIQVLRTANPRRASLNLSRLDRQDPKYFKAPLIITESDNLAEKLPFTPERGDHAQTVVLIARNVAEFRAKMEEAAAAKKFKNKQIALVTCGDAFLESAQLREKLLNEGALMVWVPDRQVTQEAGNRLIEYIKKVHASPAYQAKPAAERRTIDLLIDNALQQWQKDHPNDTSLILFLESSPWVRLSPASQLGHRMV